MWSISCVCTSSYANKCQYLSSVFSFQVILSDPCMLHCGFRINLSNCLLSIWSGSITCSCPPSPSIQFHTALKPWISAPLRPSRIQKVSLRAREIQHQGRILQSSQSLLYPILSSRLPAGQVDAIHPAHHRGAHAEHQHIVLANLLPQQNLGCLLLVASRRPTLVGLPGHPHPPGLCTPLPRLLLMVCLWFVIFYVTALLVTY